MKRRNVLVLGAGAVLGGVGLWTVATSESRQRNRTDKEVIERYLPGLGPLVEAHWATSRDGEAEGRSLPSPDLIITAILRLQPGKVAALTADGDFGAAGTDVNTSGWYEKGLSDFLPAGAQWVHSEAFDEKVLSKFESGQCYLDRATDTAFVRAANPISSGAPATATPVVTSSF